MACRGDETARSGYDLTKDGKRRIERVAPL